MMIDCQIQGYIKSLKYEGTSQKCNGTFQVHIRESQEILVYISSMRELLKSLLVLIKLKAHMDSKPLSFLYLKRHIRKVPGLLELMVA
jgi:hypothetical protein